MVIIQLPIMGDCDGDHFILGEAKPHEARRVPTDWWPKPMSDRPGQGGHEARNI